MLDIAEDPKGAQTHLEQALEARKEVLGPEHPDTAESLHSLGTLLYRRGRYEEALPYIRQAADINEQTLGPKHRATLISLDLLTDLFSQLGDYAAARWYAEEVLVWNLRAYGPDHPDTARVRISLGGLLTNLGDFAAALPHLEKALEVNRRKLGPDHVDTALSYANLGRLLSDMRRHAEARTHLERALEIRRKKLGAEHRDTAASHSLLGSLLGEMGEYKVAQAHLEKALEIRRKVLGPEHPHVGGIYTTLGNLHRATGDLAAAQTHHEKALAVDRKVYGPEHPTTAHSLTILGDVLIAQGKHEQGFGYLVQGTTLLAGASDRYLAGSAERDFAGWQATKRSSFHALLGLAVARPDLARAARADLAALAFDYKASGSRAVAARKQVLALSPDPQVQRNYHDLVAIRQELAQLLLRGPDKDADKFQQRRQELEKNLDALERALALSVDSYAALQHSRQAGSAEVTARLAAGAVLVELVKYHPYDFREKNLQKRWGKPRYAAVLLSRPSKEKAEPVVQLVDLGQAESIDKAVFAWRFKAQSDAAPIDEATERALCERVWDPLAKVLPEDTKRLIIAPDGELSTIPFEAIRFADGKYLIERYAFSYVATGRDLMPLPKPPGERGPALVLVDSDYDAVPDKALPTPPPGNRRPAEVKDLPRRKPLTHGTAEADAVAKAWKAARPGEPLEVLKGSDASEEGLAKLRRPRMLYVITHGFFLSDLQMHALRDGRNFEIVPTSGVPRRVGWVEDPRLRSGLALAGANAWQKRWEKGISDGLLTAFEAENLDLLGTELVVLSACQTALGEVRIGEGALGLRRAFQNAGAQTVLASLWEVPDKATSQLMTRFFELWLSGKQASKADALRQAQLEMIAELRRDKDPKRQAAPPVYWAGFICHGRMD